MENAPNEEFLNYYADDVVIALHFNYGSGPVETVAAAHALADLASGVNQREAAWGGEPCHQHAWGKEPGGHRHQ